MPYFAQGWQETPALALADIQAELTAAGQSAGELVAVSHPAQSTQDGALFLLPVYAKRESCRRDCEEIAALRLYRVRDRQQPEKSLQLIDQLAVQGPSERQVTDPIRQSNPGGIGSTHILPLTRLQSLSEKTLPGAWFTLTGRWQHQGSPVLYGQVLLVDSRTQRIHSLLNWHSPPGSLPTWQDLEGTGFPELIVNQSVGLEPHFRAYTIVSTTAVAAPTRLLEVGFAPVSTPPLRTQPQYVNALFLAQRQLWSAAQERLAQLKAQFPDQWSDTLERQRQLTLLHARVSRRHTEREWARSSRTVLAHLLDGQWGSALEQLEQYPDSATSAILPLLEQNSARLWGRITAALQVDAENPAARIWGALLLLAKEDKAVALQWLSTAQDASLKPRFEAIATRLQPSSPQPTTKISKTNNETAQADINIPAAQRPTAYSSLFGTAEPLAVLNPAAWQLPTAASNPAALTLPPDHQWYEITLQAGYRDGQWQRQLALPNQGAANAGNEPRAALGSAPSLNLSLISPSGRSTQQNLQVQAYRRQGQQIKLLASGLPAAGPPPWMAATPQQWSSPTPRDALSWNQFSNQEPLLADRLLVALSRHLGVDVGLLKAPPSQSGNGPQTRLKDSTIQYVNTGRQQAPDILIRLQPEALRQLGADLPQHSAALTSPWHLLLDAQGRLLYSDLDSAPATLVGWLTPEPGVSALVLRRNDAYTLSEMPHH